MADLDMAKLRALAEELGYWPGLSLWTAVLVREPHTQRRQRLIRPITVGTIGVEGRHDMEPRTALACVIVARTGAPFHCAIVADIRGMERLAATRHLGRPRRLTLLAPRTGLMAN